MRATRVVRVRGIPLGGGNPVVVQSMTSTPTADVDATVSQIRRLQGVGCEIVR
ncbi:TPA: 4-hydroxy-3-methylbut-2-en-1-yl diphosphate synthase, partial [Candidatus Micrarchaeota archaeon]|nr:4-hydroxy-3-methylbut-2-en-1-yl diphosphate synthase [Candidatus Micrarchaeota archaeon]